ncbi:MAG: hypothetical protein ACFE9D_04635 [Promethearchaeota archaeon]
MILVFFSAGVIPISGTPTSQGVWLETVVGNFGNIHSTIIIMQEEDAISSKDFYIIQIFTWVPKGFGHIKVSVQFNQTGAIDYIFHQGSPYIYSTSYYGLFTNDFTDYQKGLSLLNHEVILSLWVSGDAGLNATITIQVGWHRPGPLLGPLLWESVSTTCHLVDLTPELP